MGLVALGLKECPKCEGTGTVKTTRGNPKTCPDCEGTNVVKA